MGRKTNRNFKTTIGKTFFVFTILFLTFNTDFCLGKEEKSTVQTPVVAADRHRRFRPKVHKDLQKEYEEYKKILKVKNPEPVFAKDKLIVRFKSNIDIIKINQYLSPIGKHRMYSSPNGKKTDTYSLRITNGMSVKNAMDQLKTNPDVLSVSKMPLFSVNK